MRVHFRAKLLTLSLFHHPRRYDKRSSPNLLHRTSKRDRTAAGFSKSNRRFTYISMVSGICMFSVVAVIILTRFACIYFVRILERFEEAKLII